MRLKDSNKIPPDYIFSHTLIVIYIIINLSDEEVLQLNDVFKKKKNEFI